MSYTRATVHSAGEVSSLRTVLTRLTLALTLGSSLALAQTFHPGPPAGFDPLKASALDLEQYGFPPAPDKTAIAEYAVWAAMLAADRTRRADTTTRTTNIRHNPVRGAHTSGIVGNATAATSNNWSGYAVAAAENTFTGKNYVYGQWIVSAVGAGNCINGPLLASEWVGLDGYGSSDVLQAGINVACGGSYYVWYEWFTSGCSTNTAALPCYESALSLTVSPGDLIDVAVWYTAAPDNGHAYILDVTTGVSASVSFNQPPGFSGSEYRGNSVEWVVERPELCFDSTTNCSLVNLPNYVAAPMNKVHALGTTGFFFPSSSPSGSTIYDISMVCPPWNPSSACSSTTAISVPKLFGLWSLWFYPDGPAIQDSGQNGE